MASVGGFDDTKNINNISQIFRGPTSAWADFSVSGIMNTCI